MKLSEAYLESIGNRAEPIIGIVVDSASRVVRIGADQIDAILTVDEIGVPVSTLNEQVLAGWGPAAAAPAGAFSGPHGRLSGDPRNGHNERGKSLPAPFSDGYQIPRL